MSDNDWRVQRFHAGWFVTCTAPDGSGRRITVAEFREAVYGPLHTHLCEANARMLAAAGNAART